MTRSAFIAALALTACGAAPSEPAAQSTEATLAAKCGWTDPGCNPHTAPATVELCVVATGAAALLPAGDSPCDAAPQPSLRVAPGAAWSTWVLDGEYSVSAAPCAGP
jgi:hypothetical protein